MHCEDALALLRACGRWLPKRSLIYLDPPYYVKGRGLYRNYYNHDDHLAVAQTVQSKQFKRPWIVSYDNAEQIREMYRFSKGLSYGLNYTAQKRYVGNEVMFFSQDLQVPEDSIPQSALAA